VPESEPKVVSAIPARVQQVADVIAGARARRLMNERRSGMPNTPSTGTTNPMAAKATNSTATRMTRGLEKETTAG